MTEPIRDEINLTVEFDDDFRRQIAGSGRAYNPRVLLGINAGNVSISGPKKGYTGVYLTNFLSEALDAIEGIENGEKRVLKTGDGPAYLTFEPRDDETLVFTKCFTKGSAENPDERLSVEPHVIVTKRALIREIIRVSNESFEKLLEINPDVVNHRQIRGLREILGEVEGWYESDES